MIALKIEEVKAFMAKLLTNTLFDEFILKELEIQTFTSFYISGQFFESFFSKDELKEREENNHVLWKEVRNIMQNLNMPYDVIKTCTDNNGPRILKFYNNNCQER